MEKFSSAGIVRGWAGRSSRGVSQNSVSAELHPWGEKLIDPWLWSRELHFEVTSHGWRCGASIQGWDRVSFSVLWWQRQSVENEQLLSERAAISNHHCGAQTGLSWWNRAGSNLFFMGLISVSCNLMDIFFSLEWLEMHLLSCWDFTIKTSPSLWHYSWFLQLRQKERWLQHYQHISIRQP